MLFEREPLTPKGKANVLTGIFAEVAGRSASDKSAQGVVPREVLEAYGDLSSHVRFMIEAAAHTQLSKEAHKNLRKVEKLLDALPECIMQSLKASAMSNWMLLYRKLEQLHGLLEDNLPAPDADEYYAIVRKLVRMAETVATHASVQINAASMFTLLLMQAHLHKYAPTRRKATRRNTKAKKAKKQKKSSKTDK